MPIELKVICEYVLIVGGRAVSMPPPGALVEAAPRRASRAREGDTFLVLITPAAQTRATAAFFEGLARRAADTYFASTGSITGGLREALFAINQQALVHTETGEGPRAVHALALALRGDELYAARSGQLFASLSQADGLRSLPGDRRDPLIMNLPPLGSSSEPDIQLARYTVTPGQTVLMADAGLVEADEAALRSVLDSPTIREAAERLKPLGGAQTSALLARFVAPDAPEAAAQPDTSRPASSPVSAPALPPDLPETPSPEPAPVLAGVPLVVPRAGRAALLRRIGFAVPDMVRRRRPSPVQRAALIVRRTARDALRALLAGLLGIVRLLQKMLNALLPAPGEDGKAGISTEVAVSMAILIPIVIVIVVLGLALSQQGRTEFEAFLDQAQRAHQDALARSAGACDDPTLRPTWVEVLRLADQAGRFRPDDPAVLQIRADAQNFLDCFDKVLRRDVTALHEFPAGADLVGPVVHNGVDLYVLDRANGIVYHDTLNETGDSLTARGEIPIRRGQAINAYTVGDLFDIEWMRSGGTVHDNVLIAIDRDGLLVSYSPTFFASAQQLVIEGRWQDPVSIAVFRANLYVLDRGANQIWRYVPPAGERRYSNAPEEYFTGLVRPDLSTAVDFGITETGDVYILFADGSIQQYRGGEEQSFIFSEHPSGTLTSGTALFVDNDPASRNLYVIDAASQTLYEMSWAGTFRAGYRPRNKPEAFRDLSGLYADTVMRNNMYVVAGNTLYHFRRN